MNWQPIETAPKEGTAILVYDGDIMTTAAWNKMFYDEDPEWVILTYDDWDLDSPRFSPTHWMPLPDPPG